MRVIARSAIREFLDSNASYADSKEALEAWYHHTLKADWSTPAELKEQFKNASILQDGRVVFNIAGNKYRLVVWINYTYRVVYIRFIGTHGRYDTIDVQTI
jgi:mRNA interferase HigB